MNLDQRLKSIMRRKAEVVELAYRDIRITDADHGRRGILVSLDNLLSIRIENGVIVLEKGNLTGISSEDLGVMLENLACNAKDAEEGISGYGFVSTIPLAAVTAETHQAYSDYFSAQRHIRIFGMENFRRFQQVGMEAYLQRVRDYIARAPTKQGKEDAIASYYKEQIKNNLLEDSPDILPVIQLFIAPFAECFQRIRDLDSPWPIKAELLYLMATVLHHTVDIVDSYERGKIILTVPRPRRHGTRLYATGSLSLSAFYSSSEIEQLMIDRYVTLARRSSDQVA